MLQTYINWMRNAFFAWAWKEEAESQKFLFQCTIEAAAQALG